MLTIIGELKGEEIVRWISDNVPHKGDRISILSNIDGSYAFYKVTSREWDMLTHQHSSVTMAVMQQVLLALKTVQCRIKA